MVSTRNCINGLVEYLESLNISVNLAKNKARGNKGFFFAKGSAYRIDISKIVDEEAVLSVLAHEFAHFVHYSYDKTLESLDFIFENFNDEILEELISITVELIPKNGIKPVFDKKDELKTEIKVLTNELTKSFDKSEFNNIEKKIKKTPLKYLLKYDKVKVFEGLSFKFYSIDELDTNSDFYLFLKLKSKQRALNRINAKLNRLNKYYNSHTELFARSFEMYVTNKKLLMEKAPRVCACYDNVISKNKVQLLTDFVKKCEKLF